MRLINLDMDALRSFVLGIEGGSFARAADQLGRSTSAVSAQLRKLEMQADTALIRKSGRGLVLTDGGEVLLAYAKRMLDLNDQAVNAVRGVELEGWIRLGLQEDFGETILPQVLGRFARAHPKVKIEGRISRNAELLEKVASGHLDLALAWDNGVSAPNIEPVASLPLCWLGSAENEVGWHRDSGEPLPLIALEAPCMLRTIACDHLDRAGIAWRIAFVTPSLGGLWAATAAGLGIALRTPVGRPATVKLLEHTANALPELPALGLALYRPNHDVGPIAEHLAAIIRQALGEALPNEWLSRPLAVAAA